MNDTVDSVYRFVTDQSSTAYSKMNSFVSSLRRRLDKVLTVTAPPNSLPTHSSSVASRDGEILLLKDTITDAYLMLAMIDNDNKNSINAHYELKECLHAAENLQRQSCSPTTARRFITEIRSLMSLSHSDEYYSSNPKYDQNRRPEKNLNVYDTLSKHRPLARSNPNVQDVSKPVETGKPAHIQRHSLRSSMRNLLKRRTIKIPSKKFLGPSTDSQTPHIYESLDTPSPDLTPPLDTSSSAPEPSFAASPIIKSSGEFNVKSAISRVWINENSYY
ncbi:unnamed protein product [Adineta ricciae]|uniref:Uncharacterized protein n=1 Tax=Adineta ricciae TaxID=249248 RepID=A0A815VU55_ADIRI|nr:unnamed protein product [Adineta ricciae]